MPFPPTERVAKLSHFHPRFPDPEYPLLALLYAVILGGEHALYCDFTADYAEAYLIGRMNDPEFEVQKVKLLKVLGDIDKRRQDPPDPAHPTEPTDAEWDIICSVLAAELKRGHMPFPVW